MGCRRNRPNSWQNRNSSIIKKMGTFSKTFSSSFSAGNNVGILIPFNAIIEEDSFRYITEEDSNNILIEED